MAGNRASRHAVAELQRSFANAAAVPAAVAGWVAGGIGNIEHKHGAIYGHAYVSQVDLSTTTVFYNNPLDPEAPREYLIPVLDGNGAPGSAYWARFDGGQFVGYLDQNLQRDWTFGYQRGAGGTFDKAKGGTADTVRALIANFGVTSVTQAEASKSSDYAGKLPGEKSNTPRNRIDRQGPSRGGSHAKFAVQIGSKTYAGIEMPHSIDFPVDTVRNAFTQSIAYGTYAQLTRT